MRDVALQDLTAAFGDPGVWFGFGFGAGGVAYLAHIGGFLIGLATGYLYKKSHGSEYMYGTRYGWKGNY